MPGTVVRDSLAADLLATHVLTTAGAAGSTSTVVELAWPGLVQFVLNVAAVTGTTPTMKIDIEGSEDVAFGAGTVTTIAEINVGDENDSTVFSAVTHCDSRYVRAKVVIVGTSGVYTGATLKAVLPHDRRVRSKFPTTQTLT